MITTVCARLRLLAALALSAGMVTACAPVVSGAAPIALPPGLVETARLGSITLSTAWLDSEEDFAETFSEEVREELETCAYGTYTLNLRVHVEALDRADRLQTLIDGQGMHRLSAVAELVDPARGNEVVGRYPLRVGAQAGGPLEAAFGDRQMMVSEEFGRALCDEAFGRNPRRPGPWNATRG